jgi:Ca2+/Na+ antiporter
VRINTLLLGAILVALFFLVAVQVTVSTGLLYRYYAVNTLVKRVQRGVSTPGEDDYSRYHQALASGCEPIGPPVVTIRCPFWVTP